MVAGPARRQRRGQQKRVNEDDGDLGMVTVETAISLGGVVAVVLALIMSLSVASAKGQACHAAREAARAVSLGASAPTANGLEVSVTVEGTWVSARAAAPAVSLGPWSAPAVACQISTVAEPFRWSGD